MAKKDKKRIYVCQACGATTPKWLGRCPTCGEWETLLEERKGGRGREERRRATAVPLSELEKRSLDRIASGNPEFDRALGGGIVPGSLVLLGGEPGIGKSTLLLQIGDLLSEQGLLVLYVAGEESAEQIKMRSDRIGIQGSRILVSSETRLEGILEEVEKRKPGVLIVDSVQTVSSEELTSVPGSIGQIREAALQFLSLAKERGIPVFLIGHITKEGALAGPKALEHIVDVVLYFEGDRHQNQKLVRAVKNRFGPANELGIFDMTSRGLRCVENPSELFLSERSDEASGSSVASAIQGSRPVLVELQALVSRSNFSSGKRMANGIDRNRVSLLLAMLEKRLGLHLLGSDVYLNVVGGLNLSEPAVDLPLVAAVISSFYDSPLPSSLVLFGELGLAGEVRAVSQADVRAREAQNMGFQRVLCPRGNESSLRSLDKVEIVPIGSVADLVKVMAL